MRVSAIFRTIHLAGLVAMAAIPGASLPASAGRATLNIVLVLDGLRPDSITPEETPNLWRLRQEGVSFINGHSGFPTDTPGHATVIRTGPSPGRNGKICHRIDLRAADPNRSVRTDEPENQLR